MKLHKSITIERVTSILETSSLSLANPGICIACGEDQDGCEGDAENYFCENCEDNKVFGVSGLLFHLAV